tara:strand:- start:229 stop:435 length:207 start_codon:yes stop_codon:yes gene_type:complete
MKKMKKIIKYWSKYYAIFLAFISFLYSVSLWFSGYQLEGIFVGIWVPSILGFYLAIHQANFNNKNSKL